MAASVDVREHPVRGSTRERSACSASFRAMRFRQRECAEVKSNDGWIWLVCFAKCLFHQVAESYMETARRQQQILREQQLILDADYIHMGAVQQDLMLVGIDRIIITLPFGGWIIYTKTEDKVLGKGAVYC